MSGTMTLNLQAYDPKQDAAPSHGGRPLTSSLRSSIRQLRDLLEEQKDITLDGESLDLGSTVAVARFGYNASFSDDGYAAQRMNTSVDQLGQKLKNSEMVYGVTTGYGGSADTRTDSYVDLQRALIQHQSAAILLPSDRGLPQSSSFVDSLRSHAIPVPIVRAAMLTRCNSLLRGHSAVRPDVVRHLLTLLEKDMTPVVPLRGSISACGDLMPLSYVAGALEGNPDISVNCGKHQSYRVLPADQALALAGLKPLELQAKEGLGILNGTAFSAGAASLVLFEANQLILLSQVLTAMGTEALLGKRGNYDPFIAIARPHPGQKEVAANIFDFLSGSKLVSEADPGKIGTAQDSHVLAQDRYALRTSSQWIGPQLEDLALALKQVEVELNSTTDNPLIDPDSAEVHHGGNFQAASVTSAMEKTMGAMQMIGKMVFSQCTEMINPVLNKGLTPNLCVDDPSLSYTMKGVDINMAGYMSELAYLAHPVSNYVQSAEMHNQGLNSLALIAARYTGDAVEVLSIMSAAYLYVLCQALDLRALHLEFVKQAHQEIKRVTQHLCGPTVSQLVDGSLWEEIMGHWGRTSNRNLSDRADVAATSSIGLLLSFISEHGTADVHPDHADLNDVAKALRWKESVAAVLTETYNGVRESFLRERTTERYLCHASKNMYNVVRETLNVPIHRGIIDHATKESSDGRSRADKPLIGSHISKIYTALRAGELQDALLHCFE